MTENPKKSQATTKADYLKMQSMWLCIFSNRQFEDSFENAQWRKVQQMQPMHWLLAATTKPTFLNPDYLQIVYTATHKRLKLGDAKQNSPRNPEKSPRTFFFRFHKQGKLPPFHILYLCLSENRCVRQTCLSQDVFLQFNIFHNRLNQSRNDQFEI